MVFLTVVVSVVAVVKAKFVYGNGSQIRTALVADNTGPNDPVVGVKITEKNAQSLLDQIVVKAIEDAKKVGIPKDQIDSLEKALASSCQLVILGKPEAFVAYQQSHDAILGKSLRGSITQLQGWDMLKDLDTSVSDVDLFRTVAADTKGRYATVDRIETQSFYDGLGLVLKPNSKEWKYSGWRFQLSHWVPADGRLTDVEGADINNTKRTFYVTIPVHYKKSGNGLVRINFYWDKKNKYWVPLNAVVAAESEDIWPMPFI